MYIKSIKIQGFKSFADKTEIDFNKNICAIVGPNGSGKSNVVDALLWVLGEQSVKLLRGEDKMSDIIFSGSKTRDAMNKASVSILFDNSDHSLNSPLSEVEIKRSIYKTGENEYFINNSRVRLKDITDLILDVSSKFNIITQGNINALVDNKSSERRVLFENAAGVLKYKKRKEETLKKLENTKENLTRLELIIKEVTSSLKPLEKQKKEAEKYLEIKDNLENIEVSLIASDITFLKEKYDSLNSENKLILKEQEANVFLHPEELEKLKLILMQMDEEIATSSKNVILINDEISKLQSQKQINLERVKLSVNNDAINDALLKLKEDKLNIEKNIDVLSSEITEIKNEFNDLIKQFNDVNNNELKEKIKITSLKSDYNVASKKLFDLENKIAIAKSNLENNSYMPRAVKEIITSKTLSGIHNTIGNLIEIPSKYVGAINASLSSSINFIVTEDFDSAKKAIKYLKSFHLGTATFFPLDIVKSRYIDSDVQNALKGSSSFIGVASDLIKYDKKYKNIIENQLGNVIIIDNIDNLENIGKLINFKCKVVTLDGDILYPGGSVSGGERKSSSSEKEKLINLESEYNKTKTSVKEINKSLEIANKKYEEYDSESSKLNYMVTEKRILIENKEKSLAEFKDKLNYVKDNMDGYKNLNNNTLNERIEEILYTLNSKSKEKEILENKLEVLRSKKFDLNNKVEDLEKKINEVNSKYNKNESIIKNNEIEIGKIEVKMDSLLENLKNDYNMTYENALKNYELTMDKETARSIVLKYKTELKCLNNINIGAISEYERLNKRYEFLNSQKEDLNESSKKLYEIIEEMDDIMKKRFKESFDKISKEFSLVYRKMFKGGNGLLKLTDENDLLNCGISILAVPPGKKLSSTSALSGGEKALTAICLIFAILNVKPAPFIVLDEVEAPLDEENVIMFGDYLKNMQDISQFILITHKKKMMEYANNLYGVTMQESGVSKLVSVKLENKS